MLPDACHTTPSHHGKVNLPSAPRDLARLTQRRLTLP
jgi:hypothetical protein